VRGHFGGGGAVLLTGATGYIGSLVLEKILRSTAAPQVFVLLRPRRGRLPGERLAQLLRGPVFHLLRPAVAPSATAGSDGGASDASGAGGGGDGGLPLDPRVLLRVTAVAGDISQPGLGLSDCDRALLLARVDTVIHCAAGARARARARRAPLSSRGRPGGPSKHLGARPRPRLSPSSPAGTARPRARPACGPFSIARARRLPS
jgi:nucleoside-diphosphate-sugar epimerase